MFEQQKRLGEELYNEICSRMSETFDRSIIYSWDPVKKLFCQLEEIFAKWDLQMTDKWLSLLDDLYRKSLKHDHFETTKFVSSTYPEFKQLLLDNLDPDKVTEDALEAIIEHVNLDYPLSYEKEQAIFMKFPHKVTLYYIIKNAFHLIPIWLNQGHHIDEVEDNYGLRLLEVFITADDLSFEEKYRWITFCLEKGADPNLIYDDEPILVCLKPENINKEIAELLLDYDLNIELKDESGELYLRALEFEDDVDINKLSKEELKEWFLSKFN